ncbi:FadR/GntR family transcriptional regulator [Pseudorhodoplanes sp.]|uniref:FadR/GntR family transcriptional regulator n=1 Tax=Pseudorhodoplanes sp. TaxID=1934341 RepID=UPI003D0972BB
MARDTRGKSVKTGSASRTPQPLPPNRIFEQIVQNIRLNVANGSLKPGDRVSTEAEMAKRFGVGRSSIREALRALETFGLATVKRGRDGGIFLSENSRELAQESLTILPCNRSSLSESAEFRKALEPAAARLAASRATLDDLTVINRTVQMLANGTCSASVFADSNFQFHTTIARATRNVYFQELIPQFLARTEVMDSAKSSTAEEIALATFFHKKIATAIANKDAEAAEFWMLGHVIQIADHARNDGSPAVLIRPQFKK